ncbi:hypothetical protein LCGC14_0223730 [marine sediment metagenome]|uniref:Uncharacterized protein n=1 Tax=marine sediment metagenome TaxID=412755 RepID=A0A0F9UCA2_9ZZZZ
MPISSGSPILASDVNAIIAKINSEENNRTGLGLSDLPDMIVSNPCLASDHDSWRTRNDAINAFHCYCEADGGRDAGDTTKTGTTLGLTAPNVTSGNSMLASQLTTLETDIDNLVAQCDCDTYVCSCVGNCTTVCTCNTNVCTCVGNCTSVCSCNTNVCTCVSQCGCNTNVCTCVSQGCACNTIRTPECLDWTFICGCQSQGCSCNQLCTCVNQGCGCNQLCTCVSNVIAQCTCNQLCTCVSNVIAQCTCNKVCGCEYN